MVRLNIGLIAAGSKKNLMQNFCIAYRGILSRNTIYATETTGNLIEKVTNLNIQKFAVGTFGGMRQIGAMIEQNLLDALIFLRDPMMDSSHSSNANEILNLCDTFNIPLATNLATAELLILAIDKGDLSWRDLYTNER